MAVGEGTVVAAPVSLATTAVAEDAVCMSSVVVVTYIVGTLLAVVEGAAEVREMLCRVRVGPETLDGAVGEAENLPVAGRSVVVLRHL